MCHEVDVSRDEDPARAFQSPDCVAVPALLRHLATEQTEKLLPIAVLQEDELLCIAASGDDVVESTGKFEAEWASHETRPYGAGSAQSKTDPASVSP